MTGDKTRKKGQSGVELMMTYGWVVVVGVGAVILLSQMGSFHPVPCEKNRFGFSQVIPTDWGIFRDSNIMIVKLENLAGDPVEVLDATVTLENITCKPDSAVPINPGTDVFLKLKCSSEPSLSEKYNGGDCYRADATFVYQNNVTGYSDESKGNIRGVIEEGNVVTTTTTTSTTTTTTTSTTTTTVDLPPDLELISPCDCCDVNGNPVHGTPICP